MMNLLPVGWLIIGYQSYDGCVISIFDVGVGWVDAGAVMDEERVEEVAEDTPCGVPVLRMRVDGVRPPILMFCGLLLRKFSIQTTKH